MSDSARVETGRAPLSARRRAARIEARRRIAGRTSQPIAPALAEIDPLTRGLGSVEDRAIGAGVALGAALAIHAAVFGIGWWFGGDDDADRPTTAVAIEVRERKIDPPPLPKIELPKIEPETPRVEPPPKPREPAKREPEPPPRDKPAPQPPRRVVGLNLEATTEGGGGPTFAIGDTAHGKTADTAEAPEKPKPVDTKAPPQESAKQGGGTGTNRAASRIPTAGAKYVLPKRKQPSKPPYPETLKSQGIEADVTVIVQIDETGKVTSVKIAKGADYPEFNEAARKTAEAEEFSPATRDGVAVPYTLSFTYRFRLED